MDYELQDGEGEFGVIGKTLADFIAEAEICENTAMRYVNKALKNCGIVPISC